MEASAFFVANLAWKKRCISTVNNWNNIELYNQCSLGLYYIIVAWYLNPKNWIKSQSFSAFLGFHLNWPVTSVMWWSCPTPQWEIKSPIIMSALLSFTVCFGLTSVLWWSDKLILVLMNPKNAAPLISKHFTFFWRN